MKTKFYYIMMCLAMVLGALTFASCKDDDEDNDTKNPSNKNELLGYWLPKALLMATPS